MHPRCLIWLLFLALLGEPLMAAPAQKETSAVQKPLTPAQKKREAAKRKAEKKKEIQRRKAKRQRIKDGKPLLYVYTVDLRSGKPLPATHVTVQDVNARPNKKPKINKPTDNKHARVSKGLPFGQYWAHAAKTGYFPADTVYYNHRDDEDTIRIALYPETRITFTVTDSLSQRPVAANVIVRNNDGRKIMQTTSDSLHTVLAVLLDDRLPYYTVEATAVDYFPFHDTIVRPEEFKGIVMAPRELKSFVLHNIYFANGKTHILESSEAALLELYRFLQTRPTQRIRIVGHTDNIGSDRSNQLLSEGRCQEVRRAMIERGISADRIQTEGRGKRDPIVPNDSDEHRQMNRRVEIILL